MVSRACTEAALLDWSPGGGEQPRNADRWQNLRRGRRTRKGDDELDERLRLRGAVDMAKARETRAGWSKVSNPSEPGQYGHARGSARKEARGSTSQRHPRRTLERKKPRRVASVGGRHDPFDDIDAAGGSNPLERPMREDEGAAFGCQRGGCSGGSGGGITRAWKPQEGKTGREASSLPGDEDSEGRTPRVLRRVVERTPAARPRVEQRAKDGETSKAQWVGLGNPTRTRFSVRTARSLGRGVERLAGEPDRTLRGAGRCRRGSKPHERWLGAARKRPHRRPSRVRR